MDLGCLSLPTCQFHNKSLIALLSGVWFTLHLDSQPRILVRSNTNAGPDLPVLIVEWEQEIGTVTEIQAPFSLPKWLTGVVGQEEVGGREGVEEENIFFSPDSVRRHAMSFFIQGDLSNACTHTCALQANWKNRFSHSKLHENIHAHIHAYSGVSWLYDIGTPALSILLQHYFSLLAHLANLHFRTILFQEIIFMASL